MLLSFTFPLKHADDFKAPLRLAKLFIMLGVALDEELTVQYLP